MKCEGEHAFRRRQKIWLSGGVSLRPSVGKRRRHADGAHDRKAEALANPTRRRKLYGPCEGTRLMKVRARDGRAAYACIDACTGAPAVSFRVVAAIRISIASPSTSVACTVLPVMRIATDRPRQHTRNDRLRHWGGSLGSIPSVSPLRSRPAKPRITACHSAPSPAMRTPPALLGSKSRLVAAVWRR